MSQLNYCHNCRHHERLTDHVHCAWCLEFWTCNHRWPTRADRPRPTDGLAKLYLAMGWEYPA